ncbi:hypothetical protein ACWEQG_14015 [Microbispora sp. NPDC004025]
MSADPGSSHVGSLGDLGKDTDLEDPADYEDEGDAYKSVMVCVSKRIRIRVADRPCDDIQPGFAWFYVPRESKVPAIGRKATRGSFTEPFGDTPRARARGGRGDDAIVFDDESRVEVCVKQRTRIRMADAICEDENDGFAWYYIPFRGHVPAVGRKAEGGSFFTSPWADSFRARRKGGDAAKAAIEPDRPTVGTTRPPRCTRTLNGRCADATSSCHYSVNGGCRDNGGQPGAGRVRP